MTYSEKAAQMFFEGYNCAQATSIVFAEKFNITKEDMLAMSSGFGGGMGGLREQCGAVSAMVLIAGLAKGNYLPHDNKSKKELYDVVKKMSAEFKEKHGTTCCRELLAKASCLTSPDPSERNSEYYRKRPCVHIVETAVKIIENTILLKSS
jgi:C_GCAxxG_C_C family probable redox protein